MKSAHEISAACLEVVEDMETICSMVLMLLLRPFILPMNWTVETEQLWTASATPSCIVLQAAKVFLHKSTADTTSAFSFFTASKCKYEILI